MNHIEIELNERHPAQALIGEQKKRFNVIVCGRRFGKTAFGLDLLCDEGGIMEGNPVGWFAPSSIYFNEVWRDALKVFRPIISKSDQTEKRIEFITGGALEFWTLHNTDDPARGRKYARVFIDEAAIATRLKVQWQEAIRPTLTDYRGDAYFASTPKGMNYLWELFRDAPDREGWARFQFPTSANPFIDPEEIEEARLDLPDLVFRQEYMAEFVQDFGEVFEDADNWYEDLPAVGAKETGADFAYTSKSGDWTVFIEGALSTNGQVFVTNYYRKRVAATEWAQALQEFPAPFAFIGGQEAGIADFLRRDYGLGIKTERAVSDKKARAQPAAAAWNRGDILLPANEPWANDLRMRLLAFTGVEKNELDDDVDALAALYHALTGRKKVSVGVVRIGGHRE